VSDALRFPWLVFAFGVEQLRRLPGARVVAPFTKWAARLFLLAAVVLTLLWGAEASPQRISLADLAAGKLGAMQSWIIVTGDLADEPGSNDELHAYRLTDPEAPNAYLDVRSRSVQPLGHTTVSGHIQGGRDGVPAGYVWSARLDADVRLAGELPPPWTAIVLAGLGLVIMAARRTRYPLFLGDTPGDALVPTGGLRVTARSETGAFDRRPVPATLSFTTREPGAADLAIPGSRRVPVRLHSAFTRVDVGRLRTLTRSEPALRVRSEGDYLVLTFGSARERDAAFAALGADAQRERSRGEARAARAS
jgi:hypothetical protein